MSTEAVTPAAGQPEDGAGAPATGQPGDGATTLAKATKSRVIQGWDKEDPSKWDSRRAWLTLWVTTFSLIIGFCVWYLVSAVAPKLNDVGFDLSATQLYWLVAVPGLSGGIIRLIYMFLPPLVGTRNLVGFTSLLFLIPMLGWFWAIQNPQTPYAWLISTNRDWRRLFLRIYALNWLLLSQASVRNRPGPSGGDRQLRRLFDPVPGPLGNGLWSVGDEHVRPAPH